MKIDRIVEGSGVAAWSSGQLGNVYLVTPSASNYFEGLEKENICTLMIVRNPRGEIKGVISDESA
ncbi:hypothetical protein ES705_03341 [subsurface metagenome]